MKLSYIPAFVTLLLFCSCSGGAQKFQAELDDLREIQARQTAQMDQFNDELKQLQGTVEELEYKILGKSKELENKLRRFGKRVPPPPGVPKDLLNKDQESISRNQGEAADQFSKGLELLRAGDFDKSKAVFEAFLEANPDTAFSDNALFWMGICYEKLGLYDRAIGSYSQVFSKFPAEDMVPVSLFHLATAFSKTSSNEEAVLTLEKLIDEHKNSPYAKKAKAMLTELKRSQRKRRR